MKVWSKGLSLIVFGTLCGWAGSGATSEGILKAFENRNFYCKGGNESAGHYYRFSVHGNSIERIDYRFPDKVVRFQLGKATKGQLNSNWSFETLSEVSGGKIHLYERVSLRDPGENKHVYRTYEMFARGNKMFMVLYDGVNGVRDWKIRMTRTCGELRGNRIVQNSNRYWATTFSE